MIGLGLLLLIGGIFFPPLLIVALPMLWLGAIVSGVRKMKNGFGMMKKNHGEFKSNMTEIKESWASRKASKVKPENRTEKDEENLTRLRAELARDRELKEQAKMEARQARKRK